MAITVVPVTPSFAAEIGDVDLAGRSTRPTRGHQGRLCEICGADLPRSASVAGSASRFRQALRSAGDHDRASIEAIAPLRVRKEFADVSNLDHNNEVWGRDSRHRMFQMGNRLWHTDSSFKRLPALASMLYARSIAPVGGHTEFADERAAYDALPDDMKRRLDALVAEHSIFNSRARLGFTDFSDEERRELPPVPQVLVRTIPEIGRKSLYLASHAGPHLRDARAGGPRADRRADRARDAAAIRLYPSLAPARPGHVGQSLHHAPRHRVRRPALEARRAARHRLRHRQLVASRKASRSPPRSARSAPLSAPSFRGAAKRRARNP